MFGKGRKSALSDFERTADGYRFAGEHYAWCGGGSRRAALGRLWALGIGCFGALCGAGCIPGVSAFYAVLPLVGSIVFAVSLLWTLGRLSAGGEPLRDYVYHATAEKLPLRALLTGICCFAAMAGEGIFLLLHGTAEWPFAAAYLGLTALAGGLSLGLRAAAKQCKWQKG